MAASDDLQKAQDSLAKGQKFTYNGKTYTLTQLRDDLIPQLQDAASLEAKAAEEKALAQRKATGEKERVANQTRLAIERAKSLISGAEVAANKARQDFNNGLISEADYNALVARPNQIRADIELMQSGKASGGLVGTNDYLVVGVVDRTVAPRRATAGMRGEGGTVTTPEPPPPPPPPAGKNKGKGGKAEGGTVAKQGQVDDTTWMNTFKEQYPAYSDWTTTEVVDYFGQDFVDILMEVAKGDIEYTDEELRTRLKNTNYFRGVTDKQYAFDASRPAQQKEALDAARRTLVSEYGDLNLTEADLSELSRQVARSGLSGSGLKQAVYQFAFRRPSAAPGLTSPKTAVAALQGADADALRASLKAYGYRASDAEIQAALTGGMLNGVAVSGDQLLQKAQLAAKGQFGHLADQIDGGLSLDDIFRNYQSYAADVLELDPNQIDFTRDPKWAEAFGTKETGQLSLGEWTNRLKTDPKFGWQYTNAANKQAEDVALSLARAFGKVQ